MDSQTAELRSAPMSRLLWIERKSFGPSPRFGVLMTYDQGRNKSILYGAAGLGDTWLWDGDLWIQVANTGPQMDGAAIYDPIRDKVVFFGRGTWEWDGTSWVQVASETVGPTGYCRGAWDAKRQRVVAIADIAVGFCLTWEWDGTTWTQVSDEGPSWRNSFDVAYDDERQCLILFGGTSHTGSVQTWYADTWAWDGLAWKQVSDFGPAKRYGHRMVTDKARSRIVLFGGSSPGDIKPKGDTWEWNGTGWSQLLDMGPPGRADHGMAYDTVRKCVVLFGGSTFQGVFGDTWELVEYS